MSTAISYRKGVELYRRGRYDEAISALAPASAAPGVIGQLSRYYQGQACRREGLNQARRGQLTRAKSYLARAMQLAGPNADLGYYLARVYQKLGLGDRAEAQFDAAAQTSRSPEGPLAALALQQVRGGKVAQAMMTLTEALRRCPESAELHVQMGAVLAAEGRYDEAGQCFAEAIACDCACFEGYYNLGLALAAQGQCAKAAVHFDRALALRPNDLLTAYQMALAAQAAAGQGQSVRLRIREGAAEVSRTYLDHLVDSIVAEPDFVDAMLALPESEADEEVFGLLSAVLSTALDRRPNYADLHLRQSLVCQRLGDVNLARRHGERALEINPRYLQARIHLGRLLSRASLTESARQLERAVADGADYADVRLLLGEVFERLNLPDEAHAHRVRAYEINPSLVPAQPSRRAA